MNTIVYIDGGNLYHVLLRFHPELKWLDLEKFAKALVRSDHEICAVKYFTSRIKTHPYDPKPIERQNVYLQTLAASSSVRIIEGYYQNSKKWLPAVFDACNTCEQSRNGMLRIYRLEEKRTDVNLATEMVFDALQNRAESFVLIRGDSDYIGPLDRIRTELKKQVVIFNPREGKSDLMYHANYYKPIPKDLAATCQLPDVVTVGNMTFSRPAEWRASKPSWLHFTTMETSKQIKEFLPPSWHGQELACREALYQAGKVPVYDWSEVKARLDARRAALWTTQAHFDPIWVANMPSES